MPHSANKVTWSYLKGFIVRAVHQEVLLYNILKFKCYEKRRTVIEIRTGKACQIIREWKSVVSSSRNGAKCLFIDVLTKGQKFEFCPYLV